MSHHIGQTITKQIRKKLYVEKAIFLMRSIFLCILSAGCGNDNITEQAFISKSSDGNTDVGGLIPDLSIDQRYHQKFYGSFAPNLTIFGKQDILGYFPSGIDALFSGDQEQINRAFCGPPAFINHADAEIYSIQ